MFRWNKNTLFLHKICFFLWLLVFPSALNAQQINGKGADFVLSFKPGTEQNSGQSSEYFPKNVFGLPDTSARYEIPSVNPEQICSIGLGGEIILGFQGKFIRDLPGKDFTIFENAFYSPDFHKTFVEPAKIAVSKDGITFVEFPYNSETLKGCAGITPTNGNKNPFNPFESGGDSFDLADIGVDSVRFIRITDISGLLLNRKHPMYDPIVTGFDLDAVVGLHLEDDNAISILIGESNITINSESEYNYSVYSLTGSKVIYSQNQTKTTKLPFENIPKGIFVLVVTITDSKDSKSITFIK